MFWHIIGSIAAILTMFGFYPQVFKTLRTRDVKDVSLFSLVQLCTGVFLWAAYGIYLHNPIIIIANLVSFVSLVILLVLYSMYVKK